ncbi:putative pectate lyase 2 [Telopea speciosissima]|uniref:putative pectate lyase 2 n=1 Tax=Telopea speciosissima TaxID=54955 RepID=UPI001CC33ECA|nr:putative pectate lyase 2 [Telopea speciosissima]
MERYYVFIVIVIFNLYMVASVVARGGGGGGCGLINVDELKNNVVKNLYGIEVGLKLLTKEEQVLVEKSKKFNLVTSILRNFLGNNFKQAEKDFSRLIHHRSSVTNFTGSTNNLEAVVSFSKQAIIQAKKSHILIHRIIQCMNNSIATPKQAFEPSRHNETDCVVDGTKCQYSQYVRGKKLQICAYGFARCVTGGAFGPYYTVYNSDDDPKNPAPGTLRFAVNFAGGHEGGAWIIFKKSMVIRLKDKLWIKSNTTIDGRGVVVSIIGQVLALQHVENVILHNFIVSFTGDSDTIHVYEGSHNVWIDHLTSSEAQLGLIRVLQGSTDVTISNCFLSNYDFNLLLGASDKDTIDHTLRVTVHRNWFESSTQRMPHCRWGYCHVSNNYYKNWNYYATGARVSARVYSELNVFNPGSKKEVTPWFQNFNSDLSPTIVSSKDLLLKGATFHQFLHHQTFSSPRDLFPNYVVPTRPTDPLEDLVMNYSGALFGSKLKDCLATP